MNVTKIPVTVRLSKVTDYTQSTPSASEHSILKNWNPDAKVEELREDIRVSFQPIQPTNLTIHCIRGDEVSIFTNFSQLELEETFRIYNLDKTTKIVINVEGKKWPIFTNAFVENVGYGDGNQPKALVELQMMRLSASIRRKYLWYEKMNIFEITSKWTEEAKQQGCTDKQISYVLQELKYYNSLRIPDSGIEISDIDGVWHSDILINDIIKQELICGITLLEDIPESKKDWHPGSNNKVWDLVHPSLYPLVYGKTRRMKPGLTAIPPLKFCGGGETFVSGNNPNDPSISTKFSWLPSEFFVHSDGRVTIDSYINNLHPEHHKDLYLTLGSIFEKFVPLFDKVINDQMHIRDNRVEVNPNWYEDEYFQGDEDNYDEYEEWRQNRQITYPVAPDIFLPPPPVEQRLSLLGSHVQVIVKLANIVLTPDNPSYRGGVWHVEGMKNENIIATGIYYYDVKNITESELGFRQNIREPFYEQGDDRGVLEIYGLNNEDPLNQFLGSVLTKENRCIAFPNIYQHRVHPFKLTDTSIPGHRKILVFFLVNPGIPIVSTLTIPPQQLDWYFEQLIKIPPFNEKLPSEVVDYLVKFLDWPVSLHTAKQSRQELMDERKYFISTINDELFERPFSLCEH